MEKYDVVIIGSGPAGLTAGLFLRKAKRRAVVLEKGMFGGPMMDRELIENYPGFSDGVSGTQLASEMMTQATNSGLEVRSAEAIGIEPRDNCRLVRCADGEDLLAKVVIVAGGTHPKKLNVPGEEELLGKGVFHCATCDGPMFADEIVAVAGGGDSGITEAMYLTKLVSRVIVLELTSSLTANASLRERALANPKLEIRYNVKIESVVGKEQVEGLNVVNLENGQKETVAVAGVLVHIGLLPHAGYLKGLVPLDGQGQIIVNEKMETRVTGILAAGDVRNGTCKQIISAAGDGAIAAVTAEELLRKMG